MVRSLQRERGRVSQSSPRHEYIAGDAKLTQDNRNRSYLDLRRQLGGCKPGDSSHALICEPVSACRALRISSSRASPGGSCKASSRRRFASCASRTSRVVDWMIYPHWHRDERTKKVAIASRGFSDPPLTVP